MSSSLASSSWIKTTFGRGTEAIAGRGSAGSGLREPRQPNCSNKAPESSDPPSRPKARRRPIACMASRAGRWGHSLWRIAPEPMFITNPARLIHSLPDETKAIPPKGACPPRPGGRRRSILGREFGSAWNCRIPGTQPSGRTAYRQSVEDAMGSPAGTLELSLPRRFPAPMFVGRHEKPRKLRTKDWEYFLPVGRVAIGSPCHAQIPDRSRVVARGRTGLPFRIRERPGLSCIETEPDARVRTR